MGGLLVWRVGWRECRMQACHEDYGMWVAREVRSEAHGGLASGARDLVPNWKLWEDDEGISGEGGC